MSIYVLNSLMIIAGLVGLVAGTALTQLIIFLAGERTKVVKRALLIWLLFVITVVTLLVMGIG